MMSAIHNTDVMSPMNNTTSNPSPDDATDGGRFRLRPRHLVGWRGVTVALFFASAAIVGSDSVQAQDADGMLFGAYAQTRGNQNNIQAFQELEADLGTTLPIVRRFARWDTDLDNRTNNWVVDGGRRLMVSVKPERDNGEQIAWRSIANATAGSTIHNEIIALADGLNELDGEVWFAFHHEPEGMASVTFGEDDDFIAAWRKLHRVFEQQGVDVQWVWTMTGWSFEVNTADRRSAGKWYPGDNFVDMLGSAAYNWNFCRSAREGWRELEPIIASFLEFADDHPDKQLVLPEFGAAEGNWGAKAGWLDRAADYLKQPEVASRFAAVVYFHDSHPGFDQCNWWLDSSNPTLNAARDIATDPFFRRNVATATPVAATVPAGAECVVRSTNNGDLIEWNDRGARWSYNVRSDDRWVGETTDNRLRNDNVHNGSYMVIARGEGNRVDIPCVRG